MISVNPKQAFDKIPGYKIVLKTQSGTILANYEYLEEKKVISNQQSICNFETLE